MSRQLTTDDARQSLTAHVETMGAEVFCKYGPICTWERLAELLADTDFVRYPCELVWAGEELLPGEGAHASQKADRPEEGFRLLVHPAFTAQRDRAVPMVLYQLVAVNYGAFASAHDAETFGAAALGLTRDEYYAELCALADEVSAVNSCAAGHHASP
jgi:hypothetical protein